MTKRISADILDAFPTIDSAWVQSMLEIEINKTPEKIIVLDDDPTGVQTVHGVSVYTDWSRESILQGFQEENRLFYILTNSRALTVEQTTKVHKEIASRISHIAKSLGIPYLIISRGDSTLRGHYPLETVLLKEVIEEEEKVQVDGEIICPFFKEGRRLTLNNMHYIKEGDILVPVGETEFAQDKTFGYKSSNLCDYIEEKTQGMYMASDVISIDLTTLRAMDVERITQQLLEVKNFHKVVVNAIDLEDLRVFCIGLYRALHQGKRFLFRVAAPFVQAIGNISTQPLLVKSQMIRQTRVRGGIVVVGSHTQKTTSQLEALKTLGYVKLMEMNSDLVLEERKLDEEVIRIIKQAESAIYAGITTVIYTKRKLLTVSGDTKEDALKRSVAISEAVQKVVGDLQVEPSFVIAKGGITSSDIGTKALRVKRAEVIGQIRPGIPVWRTGKESKFPDIPYIIFPGNVGEVDDLKRAIETLV